MQNQLQSFQSVRASFGSQMDVERIQKVRFVVAYRSLLSPFCYFLVRFAFVACCAVFLDVHHSF